MNSTTWNRLDRSTNQHNKNKLFQKVRLSEEDECQVNVICGLGLSYYLSYSIDM